MHIALSLEACFPEYAQESTGGPRYPVYPVIDQAPSANSTANTGTGYGPLRLGQSMVDRYGNEFLYLRAQAGFAKGQICTLGANPTEGAISAADTVADNIHVLKTTIAGITVANQEAGNFLHIGNTTGSIGDIKLILANTATVGGVTYFTISSTQFFMGRGGYDQNAPAAAYAAGGSEVSLIRPYQVGVCGSNGLAMGVAMGTVTSGNNSIFQIVGLAACLGKAADAFTDNGRTYTVASGEVSITAGDEEALVGLSKSAYAGANSVTVPIWLTGVKANW
jgi:hypothetical protein